GGYVLAASTSTVVAQTAGAFGIGDLNRDGLADVIHPRASASGLLFYVNRTTALPRVDGGFSAARQFPFAGTSFTASPTGDVHGDGKPDLSAASNAAGP